MGKARTIKEDGNYDGRNKYGRQAKGKEEHAQKNKKADKRGSKNNHRHGKKP